jgi:YVTN family beta-propeller protein
MVAVTRNGRTAFTANIPAGTVTVLDLAGNKKLRDLPVGGKPEGIALSVDEKLLWVADLEGARVQAFDARSFERKAEIATGKGPIRVAASPDGRWIVTSNVGSGNLTLIDARRLRKVRDIPISGTQEAGQVTILFGPGGRLYIAETGRDQVAEVVLPSGKVLRRIKSGKNGDGLAIAR